MILLLVLGFIIGANFGVLVMAIFSASKHG